MILDFGTRILNVTVFAGYAKLCLFATVLCCSEEVLMLKTFWNLRPFSRVVSWERNKNWKEVYENGYGKHVYNKNSLLTRVCTCIVYVGLRANMPFACGWVSWYFGSGSNCWSCCFCLICHWCGRSREHCRACSSWYSILTDIKCDTTIYFIIK